MKLGPPNSGINSMRSRAAARDTTPERAGVSEMSRVAGRAMLSFLPTHRAQWFTPERRAEGLAPVALRSRSGSGSGERFRRSRTPAQLPVLCFAGKPDGSPYPLRRAFGARSWSAGAFAQVCLDRVAG